MSLFSEASQRETIEAIENGAIPSVCYSRESWDEADAGLRPHRLLEFESRIHRTEGARICGAYVLDRLIAPGCHIRALSCVLIDDRP